MHARAVLFTAILALAGCADDSPPALVADAGDGTAAAAQISIDACALLDDEAISHVAGISIAARQSDDTPPWFFACKFLDSDRAPLVAISVLVYPEEQTARTEGTRTMNRSGYTAIPDVGTLAYSSPIHDVTALSGRFELSVDIAPEANQHPPEAAIELARTALPRLPKE